MHLSAETALDLVEGRLSPDERAFWEQHVQVCKHCEQEREYWARMRSLLNRSHLESAPDDDLANAMGIFPVRRGRKESRPYVYAQLQFDSFAQPAFAGARGATAEARQMVLRAEEFDIHVRIWGDPDHKQLIGQLLPRGSSGFLETARLHLLRNGERFETTAADATGEFRFADIPEGLLSLQIDLPHLTVIGTLNAAGIQ